MRILHCIPSMLGGGAERQLAYLAAEQSKRGWQVDVALLHDGPNYERLQRSGSVIRHLSCHGNYDPLLLMQIIRLIHSIKPDIVQTWMLQMDILGGIAARLTGVPWVLCERTSAMAYTPTFRYRLRARLGVRAHAIVANSAGGDAYWESCGSRPFQRRIIHNALPLDEIGMVSPFRPDSEALASGQKMVLYVGRMTSEKNLLNLISGLQKATSRVPLKAFFCGIGERQPLIREVIRRHGLTGLISLQDYVPGVWSWMKGADIFVSVSLYEGQPNAVLEAIACGCPVIVSDIPAHREILEEHETMFVDPNSVASISEALLDSLEAPAKTGLRAERAKRCLEKYSIREVADKYEQVYMELSRNHR